MPKPILEGNWTRRSTLLGLAAFLSGCSGGVMQFGSRTLHLPWGEPAGNAPPVPLAQASAQAPMMAQISSEKIGRGPVPVSLLLPLSGEPSIASLGLAMANATRLAIEFIEANPNIAENITITLRDTGTSTVGATAAAQVSIREGAKLILGPLMTDQVAAITPIMRAAGVPVISYANNGAVAGAGVYVLNVLPESEMKRALSFIREKGRRGPAGAFLATPYGDALATAFRQQCAAIGFNPSAVYNYSDASEAASIVAQAKGLIERGMLDALFVPDKASAAGFAEALRKAGVGPEAVQIIGSAEWGHERALFSNAALSGAIFPAVDEAGLVAISADYGRRFGGQPPQMATIAYTGAILANVRTLSLAQPPYPASLITSATGFSGRDGAFRFNANGRSEYALVMKEIVPGGTRVIDSARI